MMCESIVACMCVGVNFAPPHTLSIALRGLTWRLSVPKSQSCLHHVSWPAAGILPGPVPGLNSLARPSAWGVCLPPNAPCLVDTGQDGFGTALATG